MLADWPGLGCGFGMRGITAFSRASVLRAFAVFAVDRIPVSQQYASTAISPITPCPANQAAPMAAAVSSVFTGVSCKIEAGQPRDGTQRPWPH